MTQERSNAGTLRSIRQILYAIRWVIIVGVYAESELQFTSAHLYRHEIRIAVIAIAVLTLISYWIPKKWLGGVKPVFSTILDIGFVTIVIFYSDAIQSPFYPLYYVTVISAAAIFGSRGALMAATAIVFLSFGAEVHDTHGSLTKALVMEDLVRTLPYPFLLAIIAGSLRDRVRIFADRTAKLQAGHEAVEREMEIARRVERAQLPRRIPSPDGAEIVIYYEPAREVGGDTYDFYPLKDDSIGITIADASGKGIPAALMISSTKYAIREHYSADYPSMMRDINKDLLSATTDDSFITMIFGELDLINWEMRFANAGHMPPMLIKGKTGDVISYEQVDPPLGIAVFDDYRESIIKLEPGDTLVFYTDGITDALAPGIDGLEVFKKVLGEMAPMPLSEWKEYLKTRLSNPSHLDDATMLAIRIKQPADV